jgi:hypothetical protein
MSQQDNDLVVTKKYTKNLLVDPVLPETRDQNFMCVSFVNPKDLVEQKKLFSINRFMCEDINNELAMVGRQLGMYVSRTLKTRFDEEYDRISKIENQEIADNYKKALDSILERINIKEDELEKKCIREYTQDHEDIVARFQNYMVDHGAEIDREFERLNDNRTSTLGFKVRAVTNTRAECEKLASYFSKDVENYVDTFVAPLRYWLPFNPDPERIDSHHQVKELDTLMRAKKIEKEYQDQVFNDRIDNVRDANGMQINYNKNTESKLHKMLDEKRRKQEVLKYGLDSDKLVGEPEPDNEQSKKRRRRRRHKKNIEENDAVEKDNQTQD